MSQRSPLKQIRRSAAQRGPAVLGKRLARRDLTRAFFRVLRQMGK